MCNDSNDDMDHNCHHYDVSNIPSFENSYHCTTLCLHFCNKHCRNQHQMLIHKSVSQMDPIVPERLEFEGMAVLKKQYNQTKYTCILF